ncbi:hypothetical protein ABZ916_04055 [Streptomyces sp. NPDC046853]|uniref:hypothetical protein n=1 Tax=Streptomyces sp. NPDC046853 TaxID=3154920 RepID=UPI003408338C
MDDSTAQTPEPAARRGPNLWMVLCLVLAAVVLGLGGFLTGRAAATSDDDKGGEDCPKLLRAAEKMRGEILRLEVAEDQNGDWVLAVRTRAYLITQNPGCFTAESRAKAQATLDQYKDR